MIGLLDFDNGNVAIDDELKKKNNRFNIDLNKIGFMPQDYCLFQELTLSETFYYFGKLYGMNEKAIKMRQDFLIKLLDLPKKNSFVDCFR